MGGRKGFKLEELVGKTPENAKARQELLTSIQKQDPSEIVTSTLKLALDSDKLLENLTRATKAFEFIEKNAEAVALNRDARQRAAKDFWSKKKIEENLPPDPKIDRIIVDSLTKYIFRGKRK